MKASLAAELGEAAGLVARVAAGASLAELLLRLNVHSTSRAALIDLTHGTLRRYGRAPAIVAALSSRGRPDALVAALLWCALYALESGRYGDHTVVDEAVKACGVLERWPAKSYVNALLRRFLRERTAIEAELSTQAEANYQHPGWWIEVLQHAYPDTWQSILQAGNTHPPMGVRPNLRRISLAEYEARLRDAGIAAQRYGRQALVLQRPLPVDRLPGFAAGEVSVQDAGAQRAAHCLELAEGQRVLDACAAPGGKAAHILEMADVELTALDMDAARAAGIGPNLQRLGLSALVRVGDATEPSTWWDGRAFDRILADVPCTASGIARRRPDVKWLRRKTDVEDFAGRQRAILSSLWRLLAPSGKLLYATCSVFPQENDAVVDGFLDATADARRLPLADGEASQWLPDAEHDGFFYALIQKQA